jgi:exodeoxyribonuclease V alpha subunit
LKTQASPPEHPLESLSGLIERVAFFNEETGFAVLKVKAKGHREWVTVVGSLPAVTAGEWLEAQGRWVQDREYGVQLEAEEMRSVAPSTREGIAKYLGSGLVKGIGPTYAQKLVAKFGESIFEVIENYSARLEEVEGIGPGRRRTIKAAWAEQKIIRQIMVFLHSHGVSTGRAVRIYKTYGEAAIEKVRANPYALARDIQGIGFQSADKIARQLGVAPDSLNRATAGLDHLLLEATSDGHCGLPTAILKERAVQLLQVEEPIIQAALTRALAEGALVEEAIGDEPLLFLPHLRKAEQEIAERIRALTAREPGYPAIDVEKAVSWYQNKAGKELSPSQRAALGRVLSSRMAIITGGPGVGKTTLIHALLLILGAKKIRCQLCAPTGRAAKRMSEAAGLPAKTIHRLLEVQSGGNFARNEGNPLDCDLVILDECSMVDVRLMSHLLRALPKTASLILVGDVDQLPSVGPGMVLSDLIQSGQAPVVRLTEVFRQAEHSRIVTTAHRMNQGLLPEPLPKDALSDFYFVEREEPEQILQTLLDMVIHRIPAKFNLDSRREIQVLAPMNRGSLGIRALNLALQAALNPERSEEPALEKFGSRFRVGDKLIQTVNNYDKGVFNGDIGQIVDIDTEERELTLRFDQRDVAYDFGELDEVSLAYAITIHKSQGSEFPAVVIPLAMQHYLLLQRNLLYTGITRGKRLVVVVGQSKALALAVRNNQTERRYSGLLARLAVQGAGNA